MKRLVILLVLLALMILPTFGSKIEARHRHVIIAPRVYYHPYVYPEPYYYYPIWGCQVRGN